MRTWHDDLPRHNFATILLASPGVPEHALSTLKLPQVPVGVPMSAKSTLTKCSPAVGPTSIPHHQQHFVIQFSRI